MSKATKAPAAAVDAAAGAAAPPATPAAAADELRLIPLERITSSPSNPRKTFDEGGLAELAASIRSKGVLQPVLLRPRPLLPLNSADPRAGEDGLVRIGLLERRPDDGFELVAGERRVRAARLAGLVVIPAIVRELTDLEVLECQVVENEQRQDVSALEKADGYAALVERHGVSVEDVAARVGKSTATVRGLLKLRRLPPAAREAVAAGRLAPQTALLIAQVPGDLLREQVAGEVLKGNGHYRPPGDTTVPEPLSYRATKERVAERYMVELKQAPFSPKDPDLGAGACTDCPKRAGNDRETYPDARADVCTDPTCFRAKVAAFKEKLRSGAAGLGGTVLSDAEAKRAFPWGGRLHDGAGYFDLAEQCWEAQRPGKKTPPSYKQLLDKHLKEEDVLLAFDGGDQLHRLVRKDVALPILRKEHGLFRDKGGAAAPRTSAEDKDRRARVMAEGKLRKAQERALLGAVGAAAEDLAAALPADQAGLNGLLRELARDQAHRLWSEHLGTVCARRGAKGGGKPEQLAELDRLHIAGAGGRELFGLLLELLGANLLLGFGNEAGAKRLLAALGVDRKQVEAAAAAKARAEAKGKAPSAAKRKAVAAP